MRACLGIVVVLCRRSAGRSLVAVATWWRVTGFVSWSESLEVHRVEAVTSDARSPVPVGGERAMVGDAGAAELVLEGVDYLAWANVPAHMQRFAARLDVRPDVPILLHFVIGARSGGKAAISLYIAAQVRALPDTVDWRCGTVTGWRSDQLRARHEPLRTIPNQ